MKSSLDEVRAKLRNGETLTKDERKLAESVLIYVPPEPKA